MFAWSFSRKIFFLLHIGKRRETFLRSLGCGQFVLIVFQTWRTVASAGPFLSIAQLLVDIHTKINVNERTTCMIFHLAAPLPLPPCHPVCAIVLVLYNLLVLLMYSSGSVCMQVLGEQIKEMVNYAFIMCVKGGDEQKKKREENGNKMRIYMLCVLIAL